LNGGLKNIEVLLKNIEYERFPKANSHDDDYFKIVCIGDIIKLNNGEIINNLYSVSGVGRKLDMKFLPRSLQDVKEINFYLMDAPEYEYKNSFSILGDYFSVELDLPHGIVTKINDLINENYSKDNFKISLNINFINPITEVYKTGGYSISHEDKIIIYLGEEYEDDDNNYGVSGDVKVNVNLSCKKPYSSGESEILFSFSH
jgi:hypothetical protein